jgi:hypothetical protein
LFVKTIKPKVAATYCNSSNSISNSSKQQAAASSSKQQAAASSKQQQAAASSKQQQAADYLYIRVASMYQ